MRKLNILYFFSGSQAVFPVWGNRYAAVEQPEQGTLRRHRCLLGSCGSQLRVQIYTSHHSAVRTGILTTKQKTAISLLSNFGNPYMCIKPNILLIHFELNRAVPYLTMFKLGKNCEKIFREVDSVQVQTAELAAKE